MDSKQMMMMRATLVVQHRYANDACDDVAGDAPVPGAMWQKESALKKPDVSGLVDGLVSAFEHVIDRTDVLRRVGSATSQGNDDLVEVRCEVEYGPIRATEGGMRRHLERQARAIAASLGADDSAIFNVVRTELTSPEQLDEIIGRLTARSNDIDVPLRLREQVAATVTRLRQGKDAGRIRRHPESAVAS